MLLTALLWLLLRVLSSRLGHSQKDEAAQDEAVRGRDLAGSIFVCASITVVLIITALALGADKDFATYFLWYFPSGYPKELIGALRWLVVLMPLLAGAFYCLCITRWRHRKILRAAQPSTTALPDVPVSGASPHALSSLDNRLITLTVSGTATGLVLTACAQGTPALNAVVDPGTYLVLFGFCLLFLSLIWWSIKRLRAEPPNVRAITIYSIYWYRQTLGALLLASSLAYLVLSLAALPLRQEADARIDAYIKYGEVVALQKMRDK